MTNSGASSSRFYWENNDNNFSAQAQKTADITVPVAHGGHFAAWEQPQLFSEELRKAFRPLRSAAAL